MLKTLSLLLILAGLALGPAYWIYVVHFTGQLAHSVALHPDTDGAWHTPSFRLAPEMGPVGLILRIDGHFSPNMPDDQAPRDGYHAILHQDGEAGAPIRLNLGVHAVADTQPRFRQRLLLLDAPRAGAYRLDLVPLAAPSITLDAVELDIRSHVLQTDNRLVATGIGLLALGVLLLLS